METIFDIGFEDGKDTAYYLHRGYKVVAVDADPKLIEAGRVKFKDAIKDEQLILLNLGISDSCEKKTFYVNTFKSEWSSFIESWAARNDPNYYPISIECITLGDLILKYGTPVYVKIYIEGNDILALESLLKSKQNKPIYISVEAVDINWVQKLKELGYTQFKLVNQAIISKQNTSDWVFGFGCSGNFGEDTPGKWVSADDIVQIYSYLHDKYNMSPDNWYDIHAK
jgi:FkbM family methyltransferase